MPQTHTDDELASHPAPTPAQADSDAEQEPRTLLARVADRHHPRVALTCSFGLEDVVLCHMATAICPDFKIFFIDTGFHVPETLALRDRLVKEWQLNLTTFQPQISIMEQDDRHGERLFQRDPDRCCAIRKLAPMRQALAALDAWVTGMRRQQSPSRSCLQQVEEHETDGGRTIVKVSPLAAWELEQVKAYARRHDLPYNPLHDEGYPSIGCFPCTRAVAPGEGPRAGRWSNHDKVECGLHQLTAARGDQGEPT